MNVEQRIAALEALLDKVQKNAAAPRPERAGLGSLATKPGDDVVGPAIPAIAEAATPIVTKKPDLGEDLWDEGPAKDVPPRAVAIAAPLGAKEGTPRTPPAAPAKPAPVTTAAKPAAVPGPKPITPVTTAAKPAAVAPAAAKPAAVPGPKPITPVTTAAKPAAVTPAAVAKPAVATTKPATPVITKPAAKPIDELKRTIPGVGDGDEVGDSRPAPLQDSDAITAPLALAPDQIEALIGTEPAAAKATSTGLPSAIVEDGGDEDAEPTKLFEPASTSKPSAALAAALAKSAEPETKPELEAKPVLETKPEPEKKPEPEATIEIEAAAPEKKPESVRKPEPEKKPEPEAAIEIEAAAPEKKPESVRKPEPEPEASIELGAAELEPKPESEKKPVAKPPVPTKKPEVEAKVETKPIKKPVVAKPEPEETKPEPEPKKGLPGWLLVAAALLLLGAGVFVAMQKGWIPGGPGATQPGNTGGQVTPPPAPTPTETAKAAPTPAPTDTAGTAPTGADTAAAPPGSASAAPAGSAAAGPDATAAPTAEAPPAKDPATLPATRGILTVTSNKQALVFLTGKHVGSTGEALEVDCGPKFLRLAEPGETNPTKAKWLTPGQSNVIACQKANAVTINVP